MTPEPYCDPVRDAEWYETESWTDAEEPSLVRGHFQSRPRFLELWQPLANQRPGFDPYISNMFHAYADEWENETKHLSSTTKRVMHPSYQAIIGMGPVVVPLLLRDLEKTHRMWFWALSAITRENPVRPTDAGNVPKMVAAWTDWGRRTGRL